MLNFFHFIIVIFVAGGVVIAPPLVWTKAEIVGSSPTKGNDQPVNYSPLWPNGYGAALLSQHDSFLIFPQMLSPLCYLSLSPNS